MDYGWTDKGIDRAMNGWKDGWIDKVDGRMNGWKDGRMDGWKNG